MGPRSWVVALASIVWVPEAQQRAEAAYAAERWEEAATAFAEAYEAEANPAFLYARAQAVRKTGDCRLAIELYAEFIETGPPAEAERNARDHMAECAREVAAEPVATPPPTVAPSEPPAPAPPDRPRRRWYADPWGGAMFAVGVAGLVSGGVLYGLARADESSAERASTEPEYQQRIDRARVLSRAGIATLAVGGAAMVGAIVRYAIVGARDRRQRRRANATATGFVLVF